MPAMAFMARARAILSDVGQVFAVSGLGVVFARDRTLYLRGHGVRAIRGVGQHVRAPGEISQLLLWATVWPVALSPARSRSRVRRSNRIP